MLRLCAGLIVLLPGLAHALDFKGLEIGAPATPAVVEKALERVYEPLPGLDESTRKMLEENNQVTNVKCGVGGAEKQIQVCNGLVTVAEQLADANVVISATGRLQRISLRFKSYGFEAVESAMLKKFGKPTTLRSGVQSRAGADYEQIEHTWRDGKGNFVTLTRFAGTVDKSSLYFASPEEVKFMEDRRSKSDKDL
jgi:hypothetical protein